MHNRQLQREQDTTVILFCYYSVLIRPGRGADYCNQFVCLSVCLTVREHISGTDLREMLCADPLWPWLGHHVAALRMRYVFPVLWMTSRLAIVGRMAMHGRLNL